MYVTIATCFEPMKVSREIYNWSAAVEPSRREDKNASAVTHLRERVQKHLNRTALAGNSAEKEERITHSDRVDAFYFYALPAL